MAQAFLSNIEYSLSNEEKEEDYLVGYEPPKRVHPSVPELSKKQWQNLLVSVEYRGLTYNQRIRKFVADNYPDLYAYYNSVGWDGDDLGNISENIFFKLIF